MAVSSLRILAMTTVAVALAATAAAPVAAQEAVGPQGMTARQIVGNMDRDGDRRISRTEFRGPAMRFAAIDADGDGYVTAAELEALWRSRSLATSPPSSQPSQAGARLDWIDVHVHPVGGRGPSVDYAGVIRSALGVMGPASIAGMVVMPPPQADGPYAPLRIEDFAFALEGHGDRLAHLGGGGSLNALLHGPGRPVPVAEAVRRRFEDRAEEILAGGARGFGEIAILHLSLVDNHPYESVPADHPLLLLLADIAARHDVVIDIHFDPVVEDMALPAWLDSPPNPSRLEANVAAFERLLAHNREAKIVWAHAGSDVLGQRTVRLSRALLARHPNLYMSLRLAPGRVPANHPLGPAGIKPEWLRLLADYPDRFVIGGDQFFVPPPDPARPNAARGPAMIFAERAEDVRRRTNVFLARLPEALARRIASENARRLYKLAP